MPNCNHCFCLGCLRTWRQAKNFESKVIRSCPECRTTSDFICPSRFWVSITLNVIVDNRVILGLSLIVNTQ